MVRAVRQDGFVRANLLPLGFAALLSTIAVSAAPAVAAGLTVSPLSAAFGNIVLGAAGATSVARSERGG